MNTVKREMSDDAFAYLVAQDVKNKTSGEQKALLRLHDNCDRWVLCLNELLNNINDQIDDIQSDYDADTDLYSSMSVDGVLLLAETHIYYKAKLRKIQSFRRHIDRSITEATNLLEVYIQTNDQADAHALTEICRAAIIEHQKCLDKHDVEPTQWDTALWASLDGEWLFDEILDGEVN